VSEYFETKTKKQLYLKTVKRSNDTRRLAVLAHRQRNGTSQRQHVVAVVEGLMIRP
jgi:hypothetical protein